MKDVVRVGLPSHVLSKKTTRLFAAVFTSKKIMRHFRVGQAKFGFFKNHFLTTVAILKDLNQKSGKS